MGRKCERLHEAFWAEAYWDEDHLFNHCEMAGLVSMVRGEFINLFFSSQSLFNSRCPSSGLSRNFVCLEYGGDLYLLKKNFSSLALPSERLFLVV